MQFNDDFDPSKSIRNERKEKARKEALMFDNSGRYRSSGTDACDCLEKNCPGCHFPCQRCRSSKCGHKCRRNRSFEYDVDVVEHTRYDAKTEKYYTSKTKNPYTKSTKNWILLKLWWYIHCFVTWIRIKQRKIRETIYMWVAILPYDWIFFWHISAFVAASNCCRKVSLLDLFLAITVHFGQSMIDCKNCEYIVTNKEKCHLKFLSHRSAFI